MTDLQRSGVDHPQVEPDAMSAARNLPFDISKQSIGAQKAYANMVKFYGKKEGVRIFLQKAEEQGKGNTIRQKVNSIYKKGAHIGTS